MYTWIILVTIAATAYAGPQAGKGLTEEDGYKLPNKDVFTQKGKQRELYEKNTASEAFDAFKLRADTAELALSGLDRTKDGKIKADDIEKVFWHPYLKVAEKKVVDTVKRDATELETQDLKTYIETDKHVKITIVECHYLKSNNARTACLADQFAKHTLHVPDDASIEQFFTEIGGSNGVLASTEALKHFKDPIFLEEIGAKVDDSSKEFTSIALDEFKDYMKQEMILYDFRDCWETLEASATKIQYKKDCMIESIKTYVTDDLTEMDISVVFGFIDTDGDGKLLKGELDKFTGLSGGESEKVLEMLDMSITSGGGDPTIDYAEFRNYMTSPTVLYQAEAGCTAPKKTQEEEIECLLTLVRNLLKDKHEPIRLVMPDCEQHVAYEFFDVDHSGKITVKELEIIQEKGGPKMHESAITRFIDEFDRFDTDIDVDLEEFNEYADIPNMVYATTDCLLLETGVTQRGVCYMNEVIDTVDNYKYIDSDAWQSWFDEYSSTKWKITKEDEKANIKATELFIHELGQGGQDVSTFEFQWYNKQQELADRFEKTSIVNSHTGRSFTKFQTKHLHDLLATWLEMDLTEDDIWHIFSTLDGNKDHEIDAEELGGQSGVPELIAAMDELESYGTNVGKVTLREFWLWINKSQAKKFFSPKIHLEKECIEKLPSAQEVQCCIDILKQPSTNGLI